jgi:hypothetical protein
VTVTADLYDFATVQLDGSGNGTAKVGPKSAREVWRPENVTVSANNNPTNEAQCQIFVGTQYDMRLRDSTESGSTGDGTGRCGNDRVKCGAYVWAVWTGGDAGQYAKITVTGTKEV